MLGFIDRVGCCEIVGTSVGAVDGDPDGSELTDGPNVGTSLGEGEGAGDSVGLSECCKVGAADGLSVGPAVG